MGITAVTVSACQGNVINLKIFETIAEIFSDPRVFVVNGRGCYKYTLRHFNVFTKSLFRRAIHKLIILRHFTFFTGTLYRRANKSLPRQVQSEDYLLLSELNAVAAKHFIFFISPILLKLEKEENDPMIGRRKVNVLCYAADLDSDSELFMCQT